MQETGNKICTTDRLLIVAFIIVLLTYIYYTFASFRAGNLSYALGVEIFDNSEHYKSISRLFMICLSLVFFYKNFSHNSLSLNGKVLFLFSIYLLIHCIFTKNFTHFSYYISTYTQMTVWIYIYVFFYTVTLKHNIDKYIEKFVLILAILAGILFIYNYYALFVLGTQYHLIESYFMITILPFALLLPTKSKYIILILSIICIVLAGKRTGFLTLFIVLLTYIFFPINIYLY